MITMYKSTVSTKEGSDLGINCFGEIDSLLYPYGTIHYSRSCMTNAACIRMNLVGLEEDRSNSSILDKFIYNDPFICSYALCFARQLAIYPFYFLFICCTS